MGDRRLRERERAWLGDADRESEQAYLRERVRLGTLSEDRYALAAALGAPGLGGPEHPPLGFQAWLDQLPFRRKRGRYERDWARVPLALAQRWEGYASALGFSPGYTTLVRACEASLARGSTPFPRDWRRLDALREEAPYYVHAPLAFLELALEALSRRAAGPKGYEQAARGLLYGDGLGWSPLPDKQLVERYFPEADGRLWGLRLTVRDALLPWVLAHA